MHRLIKGIAIALCLQWPLPASAATAVCDISSKVVSLLSPNTGLATQLTSNSSNFRLRCSCPTNQTLVNNNGKVKLSIIQNQSNVYNGVAGISFSGNSGDVGGDNFGLETAQVDYLVVTSSKKKVYEQTYTYFVKVSTLNGTLLQTGHYAVGVGINLFAAPNCQASPVGGTG